MQRDRKEERMRKMAGAGALPCKCQLHRAPPSACFQAFQHFERVRDYNHVHDASLLCLFQRWESTTVTRLMKFPFHSTHSHSHTVFRRGFQHIVDDVTWYNTLLNSYLFVEVPLNNGNVHRNTQSPGSLSGDITDKMFHPEIKHECMVRAGWACAICTKYKAFINCTFVGAGGSRVE